MTVAHAVWMAVAVSVAALVAPQFAPWSAALVPIAACAAIACLVARRVALFVVAVALLGAGLAVLAHADVQPAAASTVDGVVATVRSDPVQVGRGVRLDVEIGSMRLEAWAFAGAAGALHEVLSGDRFVVSGVVTPRPEDRSWLAARGVVGRLAVDEVRGIDHADGVASLANGLRLLVERGAVSLDGADRALFTGFVFGDDRRQRDDDRLLFRDAGLGHLLAVSGQNVAYLLALLAPALGRLRFVLRVPATIAALCFFAMLTRFEPSVMRATAMAGGAAIAAALGREADSRRLLALTVTALVLWNPLIVSRLAFRLSVAASAGILWWSAPIAERVRGPRPLAMAFAVTVAAQLAVTPLLLSTFGEVPLAAIPANVLAGPASGPVMVWGMTAGVLAGVFGDATAALLHLPTRLGIWWIRSSAELSVGLGLPTIGVGTAAWSAVVAIAVQVVRMWCVARRGTR